METIVRKQYKTPEEVAGFKSLIALDISSPPTHTWDMVLALAICDDLDSARVAMERLEFEEIQR